MIITYCDFCYNGECLNCMNELLDIEKYFNSVIKEIYGEIFDRWREYVKENKEYKKYKKYLNSVSSSRHYN
jgi:hypothetical protein